MGYLYHRALIYLRLKKFVKSETSSGFGVRYAIRSIKEALKPLK